MNPAKSPLHTVGLFIYPGVQLLDAAGPADVFDLANRLAAAPLYRLQWLSPQGGQVRSSVGALLHSEALTPARLARLHTLLVVGAAQPAALRAVTRQAELAQAVRAAVPRLGRLASVCSGAFVLAAWGLLDGHSATTHWSATERLAKNFPAVQVQGDALFVRDGQLWTSGGVTAGIDMALAMVAEDGGEWLAARVAQELILPARRVGNQRQYAPLLTAQAGRYAALVDWMRGHLHEPLPTERLAAKAGQSPRSFHRHFSAASGQTPALFVEQLRVQAVRSHLAAGASTKAAAQACGFASPAVMTRAFQRQFGMSPAQWRRAHAPTPAP